MPAKKVTKKVQSSKKVPASSVKPAPKKVGLTAEVYSLKGVAAKSVELPKEIFGQPVNEHLMTQAVLVYLANQRAGSAHTKGRGEVTGSTRKIYKQKGTGRARHGGITAPIFVGGGIAHGPRAHDFSKKLSQKMKQKALFSALSAKQKDGAIRVISGLSDMNVKTKEMAHALEKIGILGSKVLLVVDSKMTNAKKSARNIQGVTLLGANQMNTYEALNNKVLLFALEAIASLENHYKEKGATPIKSGQA